MLRELNHPNICLLMGTCFIAQGGHSKLLLVYELMEEDLNSCKKLENEFFFFFLFFQDIVNTTKRDEIPTLFQRLKIASQIASGLSWVASKGIIHGDLKPTNILRKGGSEKKERERERLRDWEGFFSLFVLFFVSLFFLSRFRIDLQGDGFWIGDF